MGRRPWAPPAQLAWLEARVPGFHAAQAKNDTRGFIKRERQAYFDEFWKDPTTGKERESMLDEDGNLVSKAKRMKQFPVWFWNRCDGKASKKGGTGGLDLIPKRTGRRHAYQAYMHLHKKRIMPEIRKDYEDYLTQFVEDHADEGDDASAPDAWWKFACARAAERLKEESDEVKLEVEEFRNKAPEATGLDDFIEDDDDGDGEGAPKVELAKRAQSIKDAIGVLPKSLQAVLERVEEQTGWKGTVLVGGPRPDTGEFSAIFVHQGETMNLGNTLPDATSKWEELVEAFNKFIVSCYPSDIGQRLKTAYLAAGDDEAVPSRSTSPDGSSTPSSPSTASSALPGAHPASDAPDGNTESNGAKKTKGRKKREKKRATSYDDLREATMANNRELFESLGLGDAAAAIQPEKPRKKREKRVASDSAPTTRATRSRLAAAAAASTAPTTSLAPSTDHPSPGSTLAPAAGQKPPPSSSSDARVAASPVVASSAPATTSTSTTAPASSTPASSTPASSTPASSTPVSSTVTATTAPVETTTPAATTTPSAAASTAAATPGIVLTTLTSPPPPPTSNSLASSPPPAELIGAPPGASRTTGTSDTSIVDSSTAGSSPDDVGSRASLSPLSGPETSAKQATSTSPTSSPSTQVVLTTSSGPPASLPATTTSPTASPSHTLSPGPGQTAACGDLPEWVTDAMTYFALVEGGDRWKGLIADWLEFERISASLTGGQENKRLAIEHRPEEVKVWMKNHRSYEKLPKIKSPAQFAVAWKRWWGSLQPTVRVADDPVSWPLPRVEPIDPADWGTVARGGCNGFFLVVLTLAWWLWASHAKSAEDMVDALEAVDDVAWVCRAAIVYMRTCVESEPDGEERPTKRMRLS